MDITCRLEMVRLAIVIVICTSNVGCATPSVATPLPTTFSTSIPMTPPHAKCVATGAYADSCLGCSIVDCHIACDSCDRGHGEGGRRTVSFDLSVCSELENHNGSLACCTSCGVPAPPPLLPLEQCSVPCMSTEPEDLVELLAGTDTQSGSAISNGNTLPQVKRPWGFNDWVPQTAGYNGPWWFHRQDQGFEGMRCTHQPSPWISDYGYFTITPHMGTMVAPLQYDSSNALFRPYHFSASLVEGDKELMFELTPTNHAAMLRVTVPEASGKGYVTLAVHNGAVLSTSNGTLSGYTTDHSGGTPSGWKLFFVMTAISNSIGTTVSYRSGTLAFEGNVGTFAVATSLISVEQAELSLQQEIGKHSFDGVLAEGKQEWNTQLRRVIIEARDSDRLRVFYTNLWKSMLFPRFLTELDEQGAEVHRSPYTGQVESGKLVSDSGFWDAYRSVYPLQSLVFPDNLGSLIDGWVHAYQEAGWLPTWPSPGQRGSMVGTMGDVSVADAIVKSTWGLVTGFDVQAAYQMIRKDAYVSKEGLFGRTGLHDYIANGYVPYETSDEAASMTLNHYIADAAIANAAKALGLEAEHDELAARSKRYGVLFNNETLFFQPKRADGEFVENFDPLAWRDGFTESGAWQYRFYVPHDVAGLQALYGGSLCERISEAMSMYSGDAYHVGGYGDDIHEMRELSRIHFEFGFYAHGNQPVHHMLWVAKKAGCDSVADAGLRKTMDLLYSLHGWAGDEDNGEMASWYVLSALGLFALEQATDELIIGSPDIVAGIVQLPQGQTLTVTTEGQSKTNVHVQSVTWTTNSGESRELSGNVMKYTDVMQGGKLHFVLRDMPKTSDTILV